MAAPEAQAAPVVPAPQQIGEFDFFGGGGLSAAPFDPIFEFFGAIPFVKIFIGNGADGTAAHPNGGNAGWFAGNGGDGFSPTVPGTNGGNGGSAGWFIGDGGKGGKRCRPQRPRRREPHHRRHGPEWARL